MFVLNVTTPNMGSIIVLVNVLSLFLNLLVLIYLFAYLLTYF